MRIHVSGTSAVYRPFLYEVCVSNQVQHHRRASSPPDLLPPDAAGEEAEVEAGGQTEGETRDRADI